MGEGVWVQLGIGYVDIAGLCLWTIDVAVPLKILSSGKGSSQKLGER